MTSCKKATARRARSGVVAAVESHSKKFSCSAPTQITSITAAVSSHTRGVSRSSRTRDEMRWTRQRWACDASAGRIALRERLAACKTTALLADGEVVRRLVRLNRAGQNLQSAGRRWQKSPIAGESTKETVKTIACGNVG